MIINSQRTIYGLELQANTLINLSYAPKPNTTINELFKTAVNEVPGTDNTYGVKYLAIGTGGVPAANGTIAYSYSQHSPVDAALFEHVPFIARPIAQDIPASERSKYRMRVLTQINGKQYYLYYLRRLVPADFRTETYIVSVNNNGSENLRLFDTNNTKLINPVPNTITHVLTPTSEYISKMTKIRFNLSPTDLTEIDNSMKIVFNGAVKPLTEVGLCGGLDKVISGITEAINTQVYFHVEMNIDVTMRHDPLLGYLRAIEIGGSEPLYV